MNIAILCRYPIPKGMAATTRIFAYSKGLQETGNNVCVYSAIPRNNLQDENEGIFEGVRYKYGSKSVRSGNIIKRALFLYYALLKTIISIKNDHANQKIDALIVSSDDILTLFMVHLLKKKCSLRTFFIFDEYPRPIRAKLKKRLPYWKIWSYKKVLQSVSAYISISDNLRDFYCRLVPKNTLVLSTIVDTTRFSNNQNKVKHPNNPFTIVYLGNMELTKDNVDNIVRAFAIVSKEYNCKLLLYGTPTASNRNKLLSLINDYKLCDKVCLGYATYDQVPSVLCNADILVSSQPVTLRAAGGFPTKVGEYLCTGNPVLITDVGETSKYFIAGEHMYYAKPEDPVDFANKLKYIINNYTRAQQVGNQGRNFVFTEFSCTKAGLILNAFISKNVCL